MVSLYRCNTNISKLVVEYLDFRIFSFVRLKIDFSSALFGDCSLFILFLDIITITKQLISVVLFVIKVHELVIECFSKFFFNKIRFYGLSNH